MTVDDDDFVRLAACLDLASVAHTDHVFGEFRLFRAALALRDHERLETFLLQATQDLDGRDVRIALGTADVLTGCEDRRRRKAHLILAERRTAADDMGVTGETGGELV